VFTYLSTHVTTQLGEIHISRLSYAIQTGIWRKSPPGSTFDASGEYFTPKPETQNLHLQSPTISAEELARRYTLVPPIKLDSEYPLQDCSAYTTEKPSLADINHIAYMWFNIDENVFLDTIRRKLNKLLPQMEQYMLNSQHKYQLSTLGDIMVYLNHLLMKY